MVTKHNARLAPSYLDVQASAGITEHTRGIEATGERLSLCHIEDAQEALRRQGLRVCTDTSGVSARLERCEVRLSRAVSVPRRRRP